MDTPELELYRRQICPSNQDGQCEIFCKHMEVELRTIFMTLIIVRKSPLQNPIIDRLVIFADELSTRWYG